MHRRLPFLDLSRYAISRRALAPGWKVGCCACPTSTTGKYSNAMSSVGSALPSVGSLFERSLQRKNPTDGKAEPTDKLLPTPTDGFFGDSRPDSATSKVGSLVPAPTGASALRLIHLPHPRLKL
jgi:hypothetical protein